MVLTEAAVTSIVQAAMGLTLTKQVIATASLLKQLM